MAHQPTTPGQPDAPAVAATLSQSETPRPPSHNGSTSSSNTNTPRSTSVEPGPTLWVEMWENQRWFPVIGWSTSRFQQDLPTFCRVPPGHRQCGSHPADFDAALNATNPPPSDAANPNFPAQSVAQLQVPKGYRWVGYWEMCKQHRHGTDASGWRYAEQFFVSDGQSGYRSDTLAPFKQTQTSLCVVRRRLWRRRVAVLTGDEVAPSYDEMYMTDDDMQTQTYLSDMDEEMAVAEGFKSAEAQAVRAGTPWTQEQELKAEEELRKFCRQRRSRESATRMRSANPSFANPFQNNSDAYHISPTRHHRSSPDSIKDARAAAADAAHSGAVAAASWLRDSRPEPSTQDASPDNSSPDASAITPHEEPYLLRSTNSMTTGRVDGGDVGSGSRVNQFVSASPTERPLLGPDAGDLQAQQTVDEFVSSTPVDEVEHVAAEEGGTTVSVGGMKSPTGSDFRAIFSQFMTPSAEKTDGKA
ncbi:hypothetical protein ABB37_01124 [Leptomonas pyrrhocoris]|uniref:Uncharacterized protein n=1 Tax=Leptomonas pyrrhocoris TaxID=157538 RepID=A0A0N0DYW3_LEPPY|nr:hypothetical protein ABB37_01124 [Leptomonas pyrrhocoris]XP_015663032.1 hypothetical protein ABB37_01124 [Leptomonas pyrrhocoris]KPA84592.1 hypothetical protein ABB37_01124 [Leptomonas pyrrhocoris]KPA84593.1 hypothetical protein ABB37_01124 [Leptomonas pyrrhocoris]|eukprot:XP_015663031.1 hypothetical protein ABB37_01124 [Leptomonas pyrrhocoris]